MKNFFTASMVLVMLMSTTFLMAQNTFPSTGAAGIGTTTPNGSSLLDITSTNKGFLFPRMTKAQRDAIGTPATGLFVFQTNNTPGLYYYDGNAWSSVSPKGADKQLDNLSDSTSINTNLLPNATKAFNLGRSTLNWNNIYFAGNLYFGTTRMTDFAGVGNTILGNTGGTNLGSNNTLIGVSAGQTTSTGLSNTAVGANALQNATSSYNTTMGHGSLTNTSTGQNNTAMGYNAGTTNTAGRNNVYIGYAADAAINNLNNCVVIGANASVLSSNTFIFGGSGVTGWGFGTAPALYAIKVGTNAMNGNGAYLTEGGAWTSTSASSKKEDFQKIEPASILSKIDQMEVTKWKYRGTANEYHYGPMAEDFHSLFQVGNDEGISEVDKSGVLFLGMQALIKENESLKERISKLEAIINQSQSNDGTAKILFEPSNNITLLGQNVPNPFDNSSLIPFRIPKDCKDASIMINEAGTGKVVAIIPISCNETHISVDAGTLANGNYSYTLYVDGKVIDTKQMMLSR